MEATILVVENDTVQLEAISGFLAKQGYRVLTAPHPNLALEHAEKEVIDLVLTDFRIPAMSGVELLKQLKALNPSIEVIIMTAFGTIESATEAMKLGAADYLTKPIDLYHLKTAVHNLLERKLLTSENRLLRRQLAETHSIQGIISESPEMNRILNLAYRVADSTATVLITGETGTGKEVLARAVHYSGQKHEQPFLAVNCAALPENLLESELFGHEKGAFTGADKQRKGRFELAGEGTLFIDEVGDIPASLQVKLLRVLQEKTFERIGSCKTIRTNARIIAATNRDLETMIQEGSFRQDLYYRLNIVTITIPPLRQRRADIPGLCSKFSSNFAAENKKRIDGISREAMDTLMKYHYPGNVRELENIIQRAVVLCRGNIITHEDLPIQSSPTQPPLNPTENSTETFAEQVENFEKTLIRTALQQTDDVQTKAAKQLGMTERHLRYKLKKYGLK
ncbi:sigma-54-dependent transcriptional regulator [Prosthecochloris sp. CIB 2401]|uniref:sigma-54-dependent transcriptional regulator n=1 Tax=Prosthecochloris sp. CIB 2401 TaxID=1868325 RepID=UPI00080A97FB|nr:sigma-54 dependent transcriptional regulator [Prosthecochloris sp. CIB 2401]ANT65383.1 Transcriptional regulatory protein ZraR [Prosthecochloris sp. CIB 2401]